MKTGTQMSEACERKKNLVPLPQFIEIEITIKIE